MENVYIVLFDYLIINKKVEYVIFDSRKGFSEIFKVKISTFLFECKTFFIFSKSIKRKLKKDFRGEF